MAEPENPPLRASDADREKVAERLRAAQAEGRLDLTEYDERLQDTYAAVTQADLVPLTADLPAAAPKKPAEPARRQGVRKLPEEWRAWANVAVILVGVWLVTSIASGGPAFFWPIFPLGIWGFVLLANLLFGGSRSRKPDDSGDSNNPDGSGPSSGT